MKTALQLVMRTLSLLLAALWLFTFEHRVACHCGHGEEEHGSSESLACACICHAPVEPASEPVLLALPPAVTAAQSVDETVCLPLLAADIFRPPLAV